MTESLTRLNDQIARDQVGVCSILETVIVALEQLAEPVTATPPWQEISREAAHALEEALFRFEEMRDGVYHLEDAVKVFDGDGYRRPRSLPEKVRRALRATCSAAELEDLRARHGAVFDFREPVERAVLLNLNPHKDGE